MTRPGTVTITGAGASAPYMPTSRNLLTQSLKYFRQLGEYPVGRSDTCEGEFGSFLEDCGFRPSDAVELLFDWNRRSLGLVLQAPLVRLRVQLPQYEVFRFAPSHGPLVNFNIDGPASWQLGRGHRVYTPHGTVERELLLSPDANEFMIASLETRIPESRFKLLPQPEPTTITRRPCYAALRPELAHASAVVIIGYSFGARVRELLAIKSHSFGPNGDRLSRYCLPTRRGRRRRAG